MPRGNVELIREAVQAWGRRDSATIRELFDEQAEFRSAIVGGVEGALYRGHDDIDRYFADLDGAFEDWHTADERYFDVGGDRVVLLYRTVGRGRGSGVPLDYPVGILFTLRDCLVVRGEVYLEPHDALKDGLQHAFNLFGRGDVDAAVDNLDPDIEWEHYLGSGAPEEGIYRGREEVRRLFDRLRDAWEDFQVNVREVVEAGEDRFEVNAVIRARGKTRDVELESACQYVLEFRAGKTVRARFALTGPAPRSDALSREEAR